MTLAFIWYILVPLAGAFKIRRNWRKFRRRFNDLRFKPFLDYETAAGNDDREFHFTGTFESINEGSILWIKNNELTIPVDLNGSKAFLLPNNLEDDLPVKIQWNRLPILSGNIRIFVGGTLTTKDNRRIFASVPGNPLMIILHEGTDSLSADRSLTLKTIKSGRYINKYWNFITPFSHIMGAFSQIVMTVYLFDHYTRRPALIASIFAMLGPIIPLIPPGVFFAMIYRRLWWHARLYRAYRDLAKLPVDLLPDKKTAAQLPNGELYTMKVFDALPSWFFDKKFPFIIPENEKKIKNKWHIFGCIKNGEDENVLSEPAEPMTLYGAFPGKPESMAFNFSVKSWLLEILAWIVFTASMILNVFFIRAILFATGIFTQN